MELVGNTAGFSIQPIDCRDILKLDALRAQRKIQTGFLNIYESQDIISRSATKYRVSEYLDWQYEDIDKNLLKRFTGLLGIAAFSIDNTIDLYYIQIEGANCPNLICYNIPPLKPYIFLNAAPHEKTQVFKKFCLLHELGHASLHFATTSAFSRHGNKLYLTLIVFLAIVCPYRNITGTFYGIIAALLLLRLIEKFIVNVTRKVNDECYADVLAIGYLDIDERKMLKQIFLKYPAKDPTLSDTQNKMRHRILLNNLELMISDEANDNMAFDNVFSRINKPSFVLLAITCGLVSILAFFSVKTGGYFTLGLFIACFVCFLSFCFLHLLIDVSHRHITDRLSNWH